MAGFDQKKYKAIFEQQFGKGSYDAGLAKARELGTKRAQVEIAKKLYTKRKSEEEKAEKERLKRIEKAEKKEQDKTPVYGDIPAKEAREMQKKAQAQGRGGYQPTYDNRVKEAKATRKAQEQKKKDLYPDFSKMTPYARDQYLNKKEKQVEPPSGFGSKVKDWFTSKDTDGDGNRDGVMGLLEKIDRPGDAIRSGLREVKEGGNFFKGVKEGWKDDQYTTSGTDLNRTFGFDPDKDKKDALISNILGRTVINKLPLGEFISPFVNNNLKNKVGKETAGFVTEAALDPLNLIGTGLVGRAGKAAKTVANAAEEAMPVVNRLSNVRPSNAVFEQMSRIPDRANRLPLAQQPIVRADEAMEGPLARQLRAQLTADSKRLKSVESSFKSLKMPKNAEQLGGNVFDVNAATLRDIDGFRGYTSDVYRNTRDVFGPHFPKVKKSLLDPFDAAKKENVELQENWLNKLETDIVKGLGIKKGSKLSRLVQDYGEKTIDIAQLKAQAPADWKKVVDADKWFRKAYDELIDNINAARMKVYPNNTERLVPKRTDYYRHFRELNGLEGIRNIFDSPAGIDPQLVGTSDFTNPSSKWSSLMQRRGLGPYKSDAVGGFLNYLPAASYAIKIDPHIPKFKELSKNLKDATGATKNLNHYIEFLEDFSKDLAGKTNFLDRPIQKILGRKTFQGLQWMNNRVKKNAVLGNVGSMLAQVANVPNGVAFAKQHSVPGAMKTIKSLVTKNDEMAQSGFLKERFSHNMYQKFETRLIDQPEKFAGWAMTLADRVGTSFVWNSAYTKGVAEGVTDPIKYADDATRRLVAGRGIGEVPLLQKSKMFQFIAPFQLEVANLWKVQKDFIKEKDFSAIITLYAGSWLLNKGMEEVRGSRVTFDPIDAIADAFTDEDLSGWEKGGRLLGEVLSNVPLGQTAANFYPEYGTKNLPTREDFFGDRDPNRFGSGLLVAKGVQDPIFKLALPFGGAQLQKTVKGIDALQSEGAYNKDNTKLKYPVENDPVNAVKGAVFGLGGLRETSDFYENERMPLGTKQTQRYEEFKNAGLEKDYYRQVMVDRELAKIEKEAKAIVNDPIYSDEEKRSILSRLEARRNELLSRSTMNLK
ncbi:hypothetical protein V7201_10745 [Bacillus sp. JJ1122]